MELVYERLRQLDVLWHEQGYYDPILPSDCENSVGLPVSWQKLKLAGVLRELDILLRHETYAKLELDAHIHDLQVSIAERACRLGSNEDVYLWRTPFGLPTEYSYRLARALEQQLLLMDHEVTEREARIRSLYASMSQLAQLLSEPIRYSDLPDMYMDVSDATLHGLQAYVVWLQQQMTERQALLATYSKQISQLWHAMDYQPADALDTALAEWMEQQEDAMMNLPTPLCLARTCLDQLAYKVKMLQDELARRQTRHAWLCVHIANLYDQLKWAPEERIELEWNKPLSDARMNEVEDVYFHLSTIAQRNRVEVLRKLLEAEDMMMEVIRMAAVLGHRDDLYIVSVADDLAQEPDTLLKLMSTEYDALLQTIEERRNHVKTTLEQIKQLENELCEHQALPDEANFADNLAYYVIAPLDERLWQLKLLKTSRLAYLKELLDDIEYMRTTMRMPVQDALDEAIKELTQVIDSDSGKSVIDQHIERTTEQATVICELPGPIQLSSACLHQLEKRKKLLAEELDKRQKRRAKLVFTIDCLYHRLEWENPLDLCSIGLGENDFTQLENELKQLLDKLKLQRQALEQQALEREDMMEEIRALAQLLGLGVDLFIADEGCRFEVTVYGRPALSFIEARDYLRQCVDQTRADVATALDELAKLSAELTEPVTIPSIEAFSNDLSATIVLPVLHRANQLKFIKRERMHLFNCLLSDIRRLWRCMHYLPQTELDDTLLTLFQSHPLPTPLSVDETGDTVPEPTKKPDIDYLDGELPGSLSLSAQCISTLQECVASLREQVYSRRNQRQRMVASINKLYIELKIPEADRITIPDGISDIPLDIINREYTKLKTIFQASLAAMVEQFMVEMREMWDKCMVGPLGRERLLLDLDGADTADEVRQILVQELHALHALYSRGEAIYKLIQKRKAQIQKMIEFEKHASDPRRLFGSSVQLNAEEKWRKTAYPTLLRIEERLILRIRQYEEEEKKPFIVEDMRYLLILQMEISERHVNPAIFGFQAERPEGSRSRASHSRNSSTVSLDQARTPPMRPHSRASSISSTSSRASVPVTPRAAAARSRAGSPAGTPSVSGRRPSSRMSTGSPTLEPSTLRTRRSSTVAESPRMGRSVSHSTTMPTRMSNTASEGGRQTPVLRRSSAANVSTTSLHTRQSSLTSTTTPDAAALRHRRHASSTINTNARTTAVSSTLTGTKTR